MNTTISPPERSGPAPVRPLVILGTCCLSLFLVSMDVTIVNVALPDIRRELHASATELQWVIDAYTIVMASFLMLAGAMADRFGRRRTLQAGMAIFTTASLLCSLAVDVRWLIAARTLQALGASMMNPVAMSIIVHTFDDPKARARAIGIWGAVAGISMALGPVAGGALTHAVGWHAIFWINVPVGVLALWLTARYVPESRAPHPRRADPLGQGLLLVALAALVFAVIESGRGASVAASALSIAAIATTALVAHERRRDEPLLDLRFFRSLPFSAATVIAVSMFAAFSGFLFLSSLYLQEVRGLSAFEAGTMLVAAALPVMIASPLSGRIVASRGARLPLIASGAMLATSALALTQLQSSTPLPALAVVFALFGAGFGMVNAPVTFAAVSGMPRAQAGLASAVASTSRQIGMSMGVALAGALAVVPPDHDATAWAGFAGTTHVFWWTLVALGLLIAILGVASTGERARASTQRIAHLLQEPRAGAA